MTLFVHSNFCSKLVSREHLRLKEKYFKIIKYVETKIVESKIPNVPSIYFA